ncbi:ribosomal protein S5 [Vittaforma corneae ATCC 50505]|uniref:Small ribosomal subunit protein uS5 n=1 Tax=Vittaforma corneae (strain ATCC 50505) TaxID=993615 RepID=L2GL45_VITCO|nr:ribosomal protein S5 [Vittaforma corneae ATCC 50505]ELA41576.1 ribosomal protein S5 [Vittaforma corneae ATCC 50505]
MSQHTERAKGNIEEKEWIPKTNLGKLVKMGKITNVDEIFRSSIRIQEPEIVEHLLGKANLKEDLVSVQSVQKQSKAGQRTSMKVVAIVGNQNGYIGIGTHSARELSTSIKAAVNKAKMNIIPVRMGQWDGVGNIRHTVVTKCSGKCGSVTVRVVPAPIGTGIECSDIHRRIFQLAGIQDIFVKSYGRTKTTENLAKATIKALETTSNYFLPQDWFSEAEEVKKILNPLVENADILVQMGKVSFN